MRKTGPEKTITEVEVLAWSRRCGLDLTVVDTSAVFNPMAGRYLSRQASESLPDLIGNYGSYSVWIELKAPNSRSAINSKANRHQREFILRKINQGCFACVTDGADHISGLFSRWVSAPDLYTKRAILIEDMPIKRVTMLSSPPNNISRKPRSARSK